jgi:hypothetical protein
MNHPRRLQVFLPLFALLFVAILLLIEHFSGGIKSHHLLNRPDLPAISNWFGLITLPVLAFAFARRAQASNHPVKWAGIPKPMLIAGLGAFLYGLVLIKAFVFNAPLIAQGMFLGLLVMSLLLPVYRAEYLFGFVLGMIQTVGGVLPTIIALVLALISFVVRWLARSLSKLFRSTKKS